MNIIFFFLTVNYLLFVYLIIKLKEYKKALAPFFLIVTTIMYTPAVYYIIFNGSNYTSFSPEALEKYLLVSSFIFLQISVNIILKNIKRSAIRVSLSEENHKRMFNLYMIFIIIVNSIYFLVFYDKFPLIKAVMGQATFDLERPDVHGGIPLYFTFSTFFNFIIPSFYFIYKGEIKSKKKTFFFQLITIFFLLVGGNKSILVFFTIFLFIFEYKYKLNYKIISLGVLSLFAYAIFKNINSFSYETIKYLISSPIDRFFVTQGAGLINRIEMLDRGILTSISDNNLIKSLVYEFIYGVKGGRHPTYFIGDFIVMYGYTYAFIFHFIVIMILFNLARFVDKNFRDNNFVLWNFFCISYLLGIAELSTDSMFRIFALLLNLFIYIVLKYKTKK